MKIKSLSLIFAIVLTLIVSSCHKEPSYNNLIGDKDKIDIKGSLSNGDMRSPNIEAGYIRNTLYVYFHEDMGVCTVTVSNAQGEVLFSEECSTYTNAEVSFYMGDLRKGRYHLVISDGYETAEGWFCNFRLKAIKLKQ